MFLIDLTLSFLGNESGLISSFLSSEELGELLDKVLINNTCDDDGDDDGGDINEHVTQCMIKQESTRCFFNTVRRLHNYSRIP